jgi:hypothetical protein
MSTQFLGAKMATQNVYLDIARGNYSNATAVNIFGFNRSVGTSFETVWNDGGNYVYPTSALTMSVVSTSAADTMEVLIVGLDINYNPISETVTLTGTSAVTTSAAFFRINSAVILAGSNVGDISINNGGTKYAFIEALIGITQSSVYTVPAGHSLYLARIDANSATTNGQKYLFIRNVVTAGGRTLRVSEATFSISQVSYDRQVPFKIAEKSDFHFEAKSSSSTNEISMFMEAVLIKDS